MTTLYTLTKKSDYPPSILLQLPKLIAKRIADISANEFIFNQPIPYYEGALKKSRYNVSLRCSPTQDQDVNNQKREQRKRKTIWFNPPYSSNLKTHLGKMFLKLLDHHFARANKQHKIFNLNTVK